MTREEAHEIITKHFPSSSTGRYDDLIQALLVAMRSLNAWDELKEKIETYKSLLYPEDVDFFRGQISALSAVQCFVEQSLYEVVGCQEKKQQS